MSDISTIAARLNGADLEFYDKASGNTVFAFRKALNSQVVFSNVDGLTGTGTNQGTALAVIANLCRFTTVPAGTGCILPPASGINGYEMTIINAGSNALQVYASGTDTIDGTAGATGYSQAAGKTCTYFCPNTGAWHKQLSA
jgi:hypothetical protein